MDARKTQARLSDASQTKLQIATPTESLAHRPSCEEMKPPGALDYFLGLCGGSKAITILERKRTLVYLQTLGENHAAAQPDPSSSGDTNATTIDDKTYQSSFESRRSSTTSLSSMSENRRTSLILDLDQAASVAFSPPTPTIFEEERQELQYTNSSTKPIAIPSPTKNYHNQSPTCSGAAAAKFNNPQAIVIPKQLAIVRPFPTKKDAPQESDHQPFALYAGDDLKHFASYPASLAGYKDPNIRQPEPRREMREPEDFVDTRWALRIGPKTQPCKDSLRMAADPHRNRIHCTIDPAVVARKVALRERLVAKATKEAHEAQKAADLIAAQEIFASRQVTHTVRKGGRTVQAAKRGFPTGKKKPAKKIERSENDEGCAIESDTDEEERGFAMLQKTWVKKDAVEKVEKDEKDEGCAIASDTDDDEPPVPVRRKVYRKG